MRSDLLTIILGMILSYTSQVNGAKIFDTIILTFLGGIVAFVAKKLSEAAFKYIKRKIDV